MPPRTTRPCRTYDEPQDFLHRGGRLGVGLDYLDRLGTAILPPPLVEAIEADGVDVICFVPHGPLHAVPFAALPLGDGRRLVERFGTCVAPSAGVLRECMRRNRRRNNAAHVPASLLTLSVAMEEDDGHPLEADADLFDRQAAAGSRVDARSGPSGESKASLLLNHQHDVVHIACHGVSFDGRDQALDSGLFLSDGVRRPSRQAAAAAGKALRQPGFLSAREMFDLKLQADLVCLRACSSGRAHVAAGDEPLGIIRGLLAAGASSMLVTKWNVDIASSARLIREFYLRWLQVPNGPPKWQALREAQLVLLRDANAPAHGHPFHWASVELIGDWF